MKPVQLLSFTIFGALFVASCGGSAPPPEGPTGSPDQTERERRLYRAGYQHGRDVGLPQAREQLATKDAELAALREAAQREESAVASAAESEAALTSCETELATVRERAVALERAASDASARGRGRDSVERTEVTEWAGDSVPCCKICRKGKACGDTCISRAYTCHKGPGCACDG
jgi:hypothetical protein